MPSDDPNPEPFPSPGDAAGAVGAGVVGMGFMGRTHAAAYLAAQRAGLPCRLAAVADRNPDNLTGRASGGGNLDSGAAEMLFDPAVVRTHTDAGDLFADPGVRAVSICTHTDTHVAMARRALEAGLHVLVEKPVSLAPDEIRSLRDAALAAGRLCVPAMCMRHWPGWTWLKQRIEDGSLGHLLSARFWRLGSMPGWGEGFYADLARSGGALFDLHVHDTDFIFHCLGLPEEVETTGSLAHPVTTYRYHEGLEVVAEGSWEQGPGDPFVMRYEVRFAEATADFDLSRAEAPLLLRRGTDAQPVDLPGGTGWEGEVAAFVRAVAGFDAASADLSTPLDEAIAVTELLLAERRSLESGEPVTP